MGVVEFPSPFRIEPYVSLETISSQLSGRQKAELLNGLAYEILPLEET